MRTLLLHSKKGGFLVLLVLFAALAALFFCLVHLTASNRLLPDKDVKRYYQQVSCQVLSKKLDVNRYLWRTYRADFLVSYTVNHVQYRRWVSGNGLDNAHFMDLSAEEDVLSRYSVGDDYVCYYNPGNPEVVVLVLRHNWGSMYPVVAVSAIFLLILYYFIKCLFILLRSFLCSVNDRSVKGKQRKK